MAVRSIYVTKDDRERLLDVLRSGVTGPSGARELLAELQRARVVSRARIPAGVITMNSRARLLDLDTGREMVCTLVFPEDADAGQGRVSVLAPIGTAMLGYRQGDSFEWRVPAGVRRLRVAEVLYQPEAAGDA